MEPEPGPSRGRAEFPKDGQTERIIELKRLTESKKTAYKEASKKYNSIIANLTRLNIQSKESHQKEIAEKLSLRQAREDTIEALRRELELAKRHTISATRRLKEMAIMSQIVESDKRELEKILAVAYHDLHLQDKKNVELRIRKLAGNENGGRSKGTSSATTGHSSSQASSSTARKRVLPGSSHTLKAKKAKIWTPKLSYEEATIAASAVEVPSTSVNGPVTQSPPVIGGHSRGINMSTLIGQVTGQNFQANVSREDRSRDDNANTPVPVAHGVLNATARQCLCERRFATNSALRKHIKYHLEKYLNSQCPNCGKNLATIKSLNRHKRTQHSQ